ncbi:hypothetical protein DPMN_145482 [Dreissena polymorpha]|uniref:Uncharacterized protein n=1 Tax=Dreissena polymorpha TaxID=45954 RepID=A0A9D4F508_DREPO|nr:hypothetical protein DPMN_145482 [Dreissena polymorpha]
MFAVGIVFANKYTRIFECKIPVNGAGESIDSAGCNWNNNDFTVFQKSFSAFRIRSDHNEDNSTSMVSTWIKAVEHLYNNVEFVYDDSYTSKCIFSQIVSGHKHLLYD